MPTATLAKTLQDAVAARLATVPALAGVPIVGRRQGVILSDIEAAVSQLGACLFVFPALPEEVNPNLPGPYVKSLAVRVRCIESPTLNTTLPDCYELAEIVLTSLHEQPFDAVPGLAGINPLQCLPRPIEDASDDERVIFDVRFVSSVGLPAA